LIFPINYNCSLRGKLSCKSRENRVMYPHVNKEQNLFTQDFQSYPTFLISDDKLM
jgi:hypothetical protein